jgi:hypothetical protein
MTDLLFLDTEWVNDRSRELVSIALVSSDDGKSFYAERDPLPQDPSAFTRKVVYPLLERGSVALPDAELSARLREFLSGFDNPRIHFDNQIDNVQLVQALSFFGASEEEIPAFIPVLVSRSDVLDELERYFLARPHIRERRHHARVDAEALRFAFVEVVG